jgi:NAD(P)-dependent dehydrogenase (short-subunit alcohol dehydrogenase family)
MEESPMFEGKVAIVTGSGTGIGEATAIELAKLGARVAVNYSKSKAEAEDTGAQVEKVGSEAIVIQANVSDDDDCQKLVNATLEKWGRIDILINNAGTTKFNDHDNLGGIDKEDFLHIYGTNVVGPYQMVRAAHPTMKTQHDAEGTVGSIVNMASIAGVRGIGSSVAYAASKGALNTMTMSLARALGPAVRVNAICPGWVGTPWMTNEFGQELFDKIVENVERIAPLNHAGTAEDVALATLFFAGPLSRHVTGETLLVDGGHHLALK